MVVGSEGFEPPKAVGRQIYSLLRLTTPPTTQVLYIYNKIMKTIIAKLNKIASKRNNMHNENGF